MEYWYKYIYLYNMVKPGLRIWFISFFLLSFVRLLFGQDGDFQPSEVNRVTINIVGDLMAHIDQIQGAWNEETQSYDFSPVFRYVKPFLSDADLTLGNLETTLAGKDGAFSKVEETWFQGYQGYPYFNSPDSYLAALKDAGFDILSVANNHSLDSLIDGAIKTRQKVFEYGMMPVGSGPSVNDGVYYRVINGIKIAFLSYTYCTNQFTQFEKDGFRVNSLNMYQEPLIQEMLSVVRKAADNSDFTVVMIHFGWSYVYSPDSWQKSLTQRLLDSGADFVAGNHPHVLQPMGYTNNGDNQRAFQIYSLSNFISHQRFAGNPPVSRDAGVILRLTLEKADDLTVIGDIQYLPTWVRMEPDHVFTILPVDQVLADGESFRFSMEELERLRFIQEESPRILGGGTVPGSPYRSFEPAVVEGNTNPASK